MNSLHIIHFTSFIYPPNYLLSHSKLILSSVTFLLLLSFCSFTHTFICSTIQFIQPLTAEISSSVHVSIYCIWYLVEGMFITPVVPFHVPCVSAWAPPWLSSAVSYPFSIDYFSGCSADKTRRLLQTIFKAIIYSMSWVRKLVNNLTVSTITLWT